MNTQLKRQVGIGGAVLLGLGSIIGTGVFISIALGVELAGPWVLLAIVIAGAVALCNGLSSAQLAANHPVAGGTYAYGYKYLNAPIGFTAGWMFLCAKSASAATAALGITHYLFAIIGVTPTASVTIPVAIGFTVLITGLVLLGLRRSNWANLVLVLLAVAGLAAFVIACVGWQMNQEQTATESYHNADGSLTTLLYTAALMFVAYTGYGRVATLGEEIHEPRKNIPIAVISTLIATMALYLVVAWALVQPNILRVIQDYDTPVGSLMEMIAVNIGGPTLAVALGIGAAAAMLGVLLNLVLGLSRVLLAMGRQGDAPPLFAHVNQAGTTPVPAVIGIGVFIAALACIGDIQTTWTFSAFTVLIYYGFTNLCALRLSKEERLYPAWVSGVGLVSCFGLAFFVPLQVWAIGLGLIVLGLVWHVIAQRVFTKQD